LNPRLRKLIGSLGIVAFLAAYVVGVIAIGQHLPDHWAVQVAYFGVAGLLWGFPLFPLIRWMNRER
jgi:uncharacterized membrane protein